MYDLELEAQDLEYSAEWRREKAQQYPEDARNLQAAKLLGDLAVEIRALDGSEIHRQLNVAIDEIDPSSSCWGSFFEEWQDYKRRIGFWEFPDGQMYLSNMLKTLLAEAQRHRVGV